MKILFGRHSILQVFVLLPEILKADEIHFLPVIRFRERGKASKIEEAIVNSLLGRLSRARTIGEYPYERVLGHEWLCNSEGMDEAVELGGAMGRSFPARILFRLFDDERVLKYFQASYTFVCPNWILFDKVVKQLKEDKGDDSINVPSWNVDEELGRAIGPFRSSLLKLLYGIEGLIDFMFYFLFALIFPTLYLGKKFLEIPRIGLGGSKDREDRKRYKIRMPIIWGFGTEDGVLREGVLRSTNDAYLYGEKISPGQIIHVFDRWKIRKELKEQYIKIMKQRGYDYCDIGDFRLNFAFIKKVLAIQLKLVVLSIMGLRHLKFDRLLVTMMRFVPKGIYYYLQRLLELENISYSVDLVKDDYNAGHVINSIVNSKHSISNIGVQHTASPYDAPQLAFVCLDRYIVYGNIYVKFFEKHWKGIKLERTGREIIDHVVELINDENTIEGINERIKRLHGESKYRVTILLPADAKRCKQSRWTEVFLALQEISKLNMDFQIFLRFRNLNNLESRPNLLRIYQLSLSDKRFINDNSQFKTQELMAVSDLVITPNASFGINEAVLTKAKVFTFDYMGTAALYFKGFGKDFVLTDANMLVDVIKSLDSDRGVGRFDCHWDRLQKELNYFCDGRNIQRMQEILAQG